ncbi:efflux RND transporter periplasmic adaptor subunit [Rhodobacterales bacterium HKCCE2091]|nr:efflux RND transporter periplasmic adaptor subunit [Rhodobacterales bacterium HKCCE2091]
MRSYRVRAALVLALCLSGFAVAAQEAAPEAEPRPVLVTRVEAGAGGEERQFFGHVAARQTVDLAFQVGGQVARIPAVEGQTIAEGELVAELDLASFELARDQAALRADQAQRALDRVTRLQGSTASQVTVDDAETETALARIALQDAELNLDRATLTAPFDALVAERMVEAFTTISAGTPVVRLHDMSELRIEIDVPELLVQRAGHSQNLNFVARFPVSDEEYPVTIREFTAEASDVGQTFRLSLGLEPPEGLTILPGSSASITATIGDQGGVLRIPVTAVAIAPDGATSVFVYDGNGTGTVTRRAVEIGADDNGNAIALSGLESGEEIVAAGVEALTDGMAVRRFTGFPD